MSVKIKNKHIKSLIVFSNGSVVYTKKTLIRNTSENIFQFSNKDCKNSLGWINPSFKDLSIRDNVTELNKYRNKFFNIT